MDQLLLLLRGRCEFCGYLKLSPVKISRFACKLRLVHHGLLKESQDLDDIISTPKSQSKRMTNGAVEHGSASEEEESDADDVVERSEDFVTRALKKAKRENGRGDRIASKVGAIAEGRRALVKEFLAAIKASKSCGRCKG